MLPPVVVVVVVVPVVAVLPVVLLPVLPVLPPFLLFGSVFFGFRAHSLPQFVAKVMVRTRQPGNWGNHECEEL